RPGRGRGVLLGRCPEARPEGRDPHRHQLPPGRPPDLDGGGLDGLALRPWYGGRWLDRYPHRRGAPPDAGEGDPAADRPPARPVVEYCPPMAESQLLSVIRMWAAVAWADGVLAEPEAEGLRRLIRTA